MFDFHKKYVPKGLTGVMEVDQRGTEASCRGCFKCFMAEVEELDKVGKYTKIKVLRVTGGSKRENRKCQKTITEWIPSKWIVWRELEEC